MDLKEMRSIVRSLKASGVRPLTTTSTGEPMEPAYVLVCKASEALDKCPGFIPARCYVYGSAMPSEIGCVEMVRVVISDSQPAPAFVLTADDYAKYEATRPPFTATQTDK